jgi:DNA segregation ATPase FtsK/SpoIIIE, S-DNA-T family
VLVDTLRTFKVEGQIAGRTTGPVVTQFEVVPAPGVKVNRIAALDADLALALRAPSIRIVAPIPGKGAVGVEVPNPEPEVVYLRRILESADVPARARRAAARAGQGSERAALRGGPGEDAAPADRGRDRFGQVDLHQHAHHQPGLPALAEDAAAAHGRSEDGRAEHLRRSAAPAAPVVTDPQDAATVLKWAVLEMERRYALLSENGARSLAEFNKRAERARRCAREPGRRG